MIRYSFALSTSQFAANHSDSGRIPAAQREWQQGCSSFNKQTALWHDAPDLDQRDGSSLFDYLLVLVSMPISTLLPMVLPNYLSIGLSVGQQLLGQQLTERDRWQRSGRYGCFTVPRQD